MAQARLYSSRPRGRAASPSIDAVVARRQTPCCACDRRCSPTQRGVLSTYFLAMSFMPSNATPSQAY